ncbi:hypothetical protein [Streptomonospora mangrovi]|uniref:hypothetical protein n=1 Tax=Streptomonospora mangrovi TaxID=2883123 RepID=UPI0022DD320B|nr:hypothetical protein [Streptomonospora mangrovi]
MSGDQEDGLRSEVATGMRRALDSVSAEDLARDPQGALRMASMAARLAYEMLRHEHLRTAADHVRVRWGVGDVEKRGVDGAEVCRRTHLLSERLAQAHTPAEVAVAAVRFARALLPDDPEVVRAEETASALLRFATALPRAEDPLKAAAADAGALAVLHPGSADLEWAQRFIREVADTEAARVRGLYTLPTRDSLPADPAAREYEVNRLLARRLRRESEFRRDVRAALRDLVAARRGRGTASAEGAEAASARLSRLLHRAADAAAPGHRQLHAPSLGPGNLTRAANTPRAARHTLPLPRRRHGRGPT